MPMVSQSRVFRDWVFEFDCWYTAFDSRPSSALLDKNDFDVNEIMKTERSRGWGSNREKTR